MMRLATRIALWLHAGVFLLLLIGVTAAVCAQGLPAAGAPGAVKDTRYCGEPERNPDGSIKRNPAVIRAFKKVFPCPTTLLPGACRRLQINHTIPISKGGCDSVANMTWLPVEAKTCAQPWCIDRWELKYHSIPRQPVLGLP